MKSKNTEQNDEEDLMNLPFCDEISEHGNNDDSYLNSSNTQLIPKKRILQKRSKL